MSTYEIIPFQEQRGTIVELRTVAPEESAALRALLSLPELRPHIVMRSDGLDNSALEKLAHQMLHPYDPCSLHAGIYRRGEAELIGTVSLQSWNRRVGSAVLGYMLDPLWWGRGYATEAVSLMLHYAFHELGITEMEGRCRGGNTASARVMIKNGMKLERSIPTVGSAGDVIKVFRLLHK